MTLTAKRMIFQGDAEWGNHYVLPPQGNMMGRNPSEFVRSGTSLCMTIESAIAEFRPNQPFEKMKILDFGCGVGRIAMPFYYRHKQPTHAVDISRKAIDFMKKALPEVHPRISKHTPPLEFYNDGMFDVIYSVSVFTHLEPLKAELWLDEIHRLLKPGGLALLSTSSHCQLEKHLVHPERSKLWSDVTVEQFEQEGRIFRGTPSKHMGGMYGCTIHTPGWIRSNWSRDFTVLATRVRAVGGAQDLNILRKPKTANADG